MKEKRLVKKIIYTVIGFLLFLIDWTRGSQTGATWAWTVNVLGVLVCLLLIVSDGIRNYFKKKYIFFSAFICCALPLVYWFWNTHQSLIYRDKLFTVVLNIWTIGICVIRLWEVYIVDKENLTKPSVLRISAYVMLVMMFLSVNEDVWPVWYLTLAVICALWPMNKVDRYEIMNGFTSGIIMAFFVLQGAAFVFRPFDTDYKRYCGIYSNPNMNALFYSIVLTAFSIKLYQLRMQANYRVLQVLCFLFMGALVAFNLLTVSKTAWMSLLFCGLVYVVVIDIIILKKKAKWILPRIVAMSMVVIISVPIVYLPVRYLPAVFHHPVWYEGEYSVNRVHSFDPWDSEKYVSLTEVSHEISEKIAVVIEKLVLKVHAQETEEPNGIMIGDKFYPYWEEETLKYSSYLGRLATWYYYFTNGTVLGHSNNEGHNVGIGYVYNWHAQNVFLQVWFYYGIVAGVLFLFCSIGAWICSILNSMKGDNTEIQCAVFMLLYLSLFLTFGLFEAVWYPGQMILTLTFFGSFILLKKENL